MSIEAPVPCLWVLSPCFWFGNIVKQGCKADFDRPVFLFGVSEGFNKVRPHIKCMGLELAGVVPGNHDRGFGKVPPPFPVCPDGFDVGGWKVVHGDGRLPPGPVVHGHLHPCLRWRGIAAPCYLVGRRKLILPAYSADASGGNVLGMAGLRTLRCAVIAGEQVLDLGTVGALAAKRPRPASRAGYRPR